MSESESFLPADLLASFAIGTASGIAKTLGKIGTEYFFNENKVSTASEKWEYLQITITKEYLSHESNKNKYFYENEITIKVVSAQKKENFYSSYDKTGYSFFEQYDFKNFIVNLFNKYGIDGWEIVSSNENKTNSKFFENEELAYEIITTHTLKRKQLININPENIDKEKLENLSKIYNLPTTIEKFSSIGVEELQLSERTYKCLKRAEVVTILDLLDYTEEDLSEIRGMGIKSVEEIVEALKIRGLILRNDEEN
ncbi:MAG: hypothetical protein KME46_34095 [Brasilonema angustatum HA4187-MV1]|jgi:uncharacterized protein YfkK (UPF0435 family)|nr:hypothetical protein [Brasilonema angustatum HA4187-MV1]